MQINCKQIRNPQGFVTFLSELEHLYWTTLVGAICTTNFPCGIRCAANSPNPAFGINDLPTTGETVGSNPARSRRLAGGASSSGVKEKLVFLRRRHALFPLRNDKWIRKLIKVNKFIARTVSSSSRCGRAWMQTVGSPRGPPPVHLHQGGRPRLRCDLLAQVTH